MLHLESISLGITIQIKRDVEFTIFDKLEFAPC